MAMGIVTGFTGIEHITPHDLKALNAAMAGSGNYVLKVGKQFAASMQTANKLRIMDGYGLMGGAQFGMEPGDYEDLSIDNGTQGMNRIDLCVARYERNAKGEESVSLRVIKGTPASGSPAVPAHASGDILGGATVAEFPLYRIQLSGLTVAAPVKLFEVLTPAKDAWDSVAHDLAARPMTWSGTTIASFGGSETAIVWDNATIRRLFPGCGDFPCVQISNGDNANGAWTTYGALQIGGAISAGGYVAVQASKAVAGNGRLNYTVIAT